MFWLLLALPALSAAPRPAATPPAGSSPPATSNVSPAAGALLGAAVTAADDERYCDSLYLFEALHLRVATPRSLYNAAEVAFAAGDRVKALDLYRLTQQRYPTFEKAALVQSRADRVFNEMMKRGPGTACAVRADTCGDWMLRPTEGGERCDDGNVTDGDGCDGNCTLTACGNGITTAGEQCDDGNATNGDGCDGNCLVSRCGNGIVARAESCDDGNTDDGDGCDHTCVPTGCGNGVVTGGEQCDDGNAIDGDGCDVGCTVSRCGNGIVTGLEQCDDGNAIDGDGCESSCRRTLVKQPLPGVVVSILSSVGILGGAGMIFGGAQSYAHAQSARDDLAAAEAGFADAPSESVVGIDQTRQAIEERDQNAAAIGGPLLTGGLGLAIAGTVGLGVGIWLALTNTEIEGGTL